MSGAAYAGAAARPAAPGRRAGGAGRIAARLRAGIATLLLPLLVPAALLLLWSVASDRGWLPAQILPAPGLVRDTLLDLWRSSDLTRDAGISLGRVAQGFALGGALGLLLGAAMGLSRTAEDYLKPLLTALAQVPTIGWVPLLMLPLGIGETLKVAIIAKAALVPVVLNTLAGIRAVPPALFEVAAVFRYTRAQLLGRVLLPAAVPPLFAGLRLGLTNAWKALVAVELLASSEGLGYQLVWGRQMMQMDVVIAAMVVIAAFGLLLDAGLGRVERRLQRWRVAA
ncbi:ABC transporter permease [Roseomonas sp. NAR14]|uniref:ABC transporter permease n=1 Tax=Roseomonas acroporae TaxID=2937791 RepID=A0A9X1YDD9_9PROT|nr:ABC transporter permease [Roseomonas acroporae]MCK8786998.1 ABC transporter permease [Roseomonas acroporae]